MSSDIEIYIRNGDRVRFRLPYFNMAIMYTNVSHIDHVVLGVDY